MKRKVLYIFMALIMSLSLATASLAQEGFQPGPDPVFASSESVDAAKEGVKSPLARSADDFRLASIIVTFDGSVDLSQLEAVSGGKIIHRYQMVFDGASLVLPGSNIDAVAGMDGVSAVYLDELLQPDTERSPEFIGAPSAWEMLGGQESAGEGIIVGVLDTGIWPEHPSFSDPDPSGKPYAAPPVVPGSNGFGSGGARSTCDFGNTAYNPNDAAFTCNNKLIGAYAFIDTYRAVEGLLPAEFDSARDDNGHGTHTSSTAAGNAGVAADIYDIPRGTISGIAPRAHVIMYRVCGDQGCFSSDSAAAVEQAILDGVDSINFSISGGNTPYSDLVSLAFLAAYDNGVFVAASAGNSGPGADTTNHREPWVTTVAASTSDRHFLSTVTLTADGGDMLELVGATVTDGVAVPTPVVFPPVGDELCLTEYAPGTFTGQIVICERGIIGRVEKSYNVGLGDAAGMLLYNPALQGLNTDNHFVPSVHFENDSGAALLDFMDTHTGVMATFTQGVATTVQGDVMAAFSSRGGPNQSLGVSKPDITAPGVQILAGNTPMGATPLSGFPGELFQSIQGTSMSSPHMAGAGAIIKALHPDWTPGQIKSALMTTAFGEVFKEDGVTPADPFDFGSGRVNLARASNPGFTFDASGAEYVAFQDDLWNSNYPSLYVPVMPGIITVERTVHSVHQKTRTWKVSVEAPGDVKITVPSKFKLKAWADYTFNIKVDASKVPLGEVRHAWISFHSKPITLRFPITIVRGQPVVTLDKVCDPAEIGVLGTTNCTITMENTGFAAAWVSMFDRLPSKLVLDRATVTGATFVDKSSVGFEGTLFGAEPPVVSIATGLSPAGYLPLSIFGITPIAGDSDESIHTYSVPTYEYAGEEYSTLSVVSNGYAIVGGGTGGDVDFVNQNLPDPDRPNNVLAPFWTDLNPGAGGDMRIGTLTDGSDTWIVVDWDDVANFGNGMPNDFQIWIGVSGDAHPGEDISFTYGVVTGGDLGFLTVGAENSFGNSGQNYYFNGVGTPPGPTTELVVSSAPAAPGETHVVTFSARAKKTGVYSNCAHMTSDLFQGINVSCFDVSVR